MKALGAARLGLAALAMAVLSGCATVPASATGPTTAPKPAMASSRGRSLRCKRASRSAGWRDSRPTAAAPA